MAKRWSYQDVCEYLKEYNCEMLTIEKDYKNIKENIIIKCSCGNIFKRAFSDYKRRNNHMCTKCKSGTHRWKYDEVFNYIKSKGSLLLSENYKNSRELLDIECECGNTFSRNFKNFKDGKNYKCPRCGYHSLDYRDVKNYVESRGCELISDSYTNNETPIEIRCKCGDIYSIILREFKSNDNLSLCRKCRKKKTYRYEDIKEFIESKECKLLSSSYENNSKKLKIECKCGSVFYRRFNNFKDSEQYYCTECSVRTSKGELKIENILINNDISFIKQYKFDDCRNVRRLPFDFYLPILNTCIEFDGRQHYEPVSAFGGDKEFKEVVSRDIIKNNYCKDNQIVLIRIPYFRYSDIKDILSNKLNISLK